MIRGVFFDAEGVLYTRDRSTSAAARDILRQAGYSTAVPAQITNDLAALNSRAKRGLVSSNTYWDEFLARHGVAIQQKRADLRRRIMTHAQRVVGLPSARATLATLKALGLNSGVITDTIYPLEMKLDWLGRIGVTVEADQVCDNLPDLLALPEMNGARSRSA